MTNPPPGTLQLFMAELMGWQDLHPSGLMGGVGQLRGWREPHTKAMTAVPNWPGSHDAARGLEVASKDRPRFGVILGRIFWGGIESRPPDEVEFKPKGWADAVMLLWATPEQWCLAWVLSEHGYKWVECENCDGSGDCRPDFEIGQLCDCSGKGGEFRKV